MATPITTTRQFRKGRVLHSPGYDFVLVDSPTPKMWLGILLHHGDSKGELARIRRMRSDDLRITYKHFSTYGVTTPIPAARIGILADEIKSDFYVNIPYAARSALSRKASSPPPYVVSTAVASGSPTTRDERIKELKDALEAAATKSPTTVTPEPVKAPDEPVKAGTTRSRSSAFSTPSLPEDAYWYESETDRKLLRDFISLRQTGFTVNLMVAGPSGSGKTVGIEKLGQELGIPVHIVNCQAITTPEKWIGQMMADVDKGTYFVPSQHIQWVEGTAPECEGHDNCILLYDEITRLRPELNNMTYSLFDTQRGLEVPQMGRRVHMNPKNLIIATANIGAAFSGTFGQDRAFRERFAMTLERDFPPKNEEVKIITSATGISKEDAVLLTKVAEASRNLWREQAIEQPISTRTLNIWALLVSGGYDVMQAAEYTVLPLYSEDGGVESDRAKIRLQIEGKVA